MKKYFSLVKILINILIHLLFWIGVYFFYTYFLGYGSSNIKYVNKFSFYLMPITIVIGYYFYFYLIPNYLLSKKQYFFLLYTVYSLIISFFLILFSVFYGVIFSASLTPENSIPLTKSLPIIILGVYFVILIVIMLGLIAHHYKSTLKNEDLKNKFLETQLQLKEQELKFLKMQIHPHFLFNTLNTLYGFTLKKADEAPDMILKLSNLLDYILYQVEKPKVLLSDEIQHIEDYVSLEKMRFQERLIIDFQKETYNNHVQISPMLLLPFVENAFKHGSQKNGALEISIFLKTTNSELIFDIYNTAKNENIKKGGIGLENIKKRLNMVYKDKFDLSTSFSNNLFTAQLKILLKNE
ncbi:Histidine kinase [Tenacibaculum halocynthiae]|nr:histidine kinase [Tenacibaculum sp. E3R01]SED42625.1 hypothetical protein SAMN04487765_0131 [Tenacibaculum sp. MAR_2010_89]